jgi:putative transposase
VTPHQRHAEQDRVILAERQAIYKLARAWSPECCSGPARDWQLVAEVWLDLRAEAINKLSTSKPKAK